MKLLTLTKWALLAVVSSYAFGEEAPQTCEYLGKDALAVDQYIACPSSKSAAMNAIVEKMRAGDFQDTKNFLESLRLAHPDYNEVTEILAALNTMQVDGGSPFELISVMAKLRMASLYAGYEPIPFNMEVPKKEELPDAPVLEKGEFEIKAEFIVRVNKAKEKRLKEVARVKKQYLKEVDVYNKALTKNKNENKKKADSYKAWVRSQTSDILATSFAIVLGKSEIDNFKYDTERKAFFADLVSSNGNFKQPVSFPGIELSAAQDLKEEFLKDHSVEVSFVNNKGGIQIDNVSLSVDGDIYTAKLNASSYQNDIRAVTIDEGDSMLNFDAIDLIEIEQRKDIAENELDIALNYSDNEELRLQKLAELAKLRELQKAKDAAAYAATVAQQAALASGEMLGLSTYATDLIFQLKKKENTRKNAVAVIIGNKNYQQQDMPDVDFAENDAELMKHYAQYTLGIPESEIIYATNATQSRMQTILGNANSYKGELYNYVRNEETEVFVYYSGHGIPDGKKAYLLPVDSDPKTIDINGFNLDTLYANLAQLPTDKVTVVIDACFSGQSNNGTLVKNASAFMLEEVEVDKKDFSGLVITSTGSGETASWDVSNRLGIFTKNFIKGLTGEADSDGDGKVTAAELEPYLKDNVSYEAKRMYGRSQFPVVSGPKNVTLSEYK
jgi:hypothetical protein